MFINVSNNLPKTSYMKMIDVWLLFDLLYPFIIVLLHTYMDTLRNDEEREINHHGRTVTIDDEKSGEGLKIKVLYPNLYKTKVSLCLGSTCRYGSCFCA